MRAGSVSGCSANSHAVFISNMFSQTTIRRAPNLLRRISSRLKLSASVRCSSDTRDHKPESEVEKLLKDAADFEDEKHSDWATTPYPATSKHQKLDKEKPPPLINPADTSVLLFPGQGTLKVGKINEYLGFPRVKDMFEIANEALGYDILKLCQSGPQDRLNRTEFNQPATVLTSLAAVEKLHDERPLAIDSCVTVAGYSVGELAALIFAGAINFEAGMRLVGVRAAAMQKASESSPQAMISVYCTPTAKVSDIVKQAENWARDLGVEQPVCRIAIYMYTQCKVLAGNEEAIKYIEKNGAQMGLRRIKRLPVSGAFHTPLMKSAVVPFKEALNSIEIHDPVVPVFSNVTGEPHRNDAKLIKKYLAKQLMSPVKWEQTMTKIYQREPGMAFPRTFDVGSSGSMKSILRNVNAKAWDSAIIV